MIVRDGRRVERDLGPRTLHGTIVSLIPRDVFRPLPEGAHWGDAADRAWLRSKPEPAFDKRAFNTAHRAANVERYRELERERARRYRERRRLARPN